MPLIASLGTMNAIGFGFSSSSLLTVLYSIDGAPAIKAIPFRNGFGTAYSNPASAPTSNARGGVSFNYTNTVAAMTNTDFSPYVNAYNFSIFSGFGTKYSDPSSAVTGGCYSLNFNKSSNALLLSCTSSPYINAYAWSASGFGTKYSNPVTLPGGAGYQCKFNTQGTQVAIGYGTNSPFIATYPWNNGFGTKYANPASAPPDRVNGLYFNSSDSLLAFANITTSPFVGVYNWSTSGFGTKYASPSTTPAGSGFGVAFNNISSQIAVAHNSAPYISAYPWSSGFGTKYANPATAVSTSGNANALIFNKQNNLLFASLSVTPFGCAYNWTSSGFGTKFTAPSGIGVQSEDVTVSS